MSVNKKNDHRLHLKKQSVNLTPVATHLARPEGDDEGGGSGSKVPEGFFSTYAQLMGLDDKFIDIEHLQDFVAQHSQDSAKGPQTDSERLHKDKANEAKRDKGDSERSEKSFDIPFEQPFRRKP